MKSAKDRVPPGWNALVTLRVMAPCGVCTEPRTPLTVRAMCGASRARAYPGLRGLIPSTHVVSHCVAPVLQSAQSSVHPFCSAGSGDGLNSKTTQVGCFLDFANLTSYGS